MMKNIFKTVSSKMFLLLLFVLLSNLSFGQEPDETTGGTSSDGLESNSGGNTEYDEYGGNKNQAVLNALNAFFSAVAKDSKGRSQYSYSMTFDDSGNGFATNNSTNFGLGVFTNSGQYLNYQNNYTQISEMYSGLSNNQYDYLFNNSNLNTVYISSWNNFDHDQFQADVTSNYYDNLIAQRDQAYWDNYVPSGVYGPSTDFNHALMAAGVVGLPALAYSGGLELIGLGYESYSNWYAGSALSNYFTVGASGTLGTSAFMTDLSSYFGSSSLVKDFSLNTLSQWVANGGDIKQVNWIEAGLSTIPGYGSTILGETFSLNLADGYSAPVSFPTWLAQVSGGVASNYFGNATDNYLSGEGISSEIVGEYFKFLVETASNAAPKALD